MVKDSAVFFRSQIIFPGRRPILRPRSICLWILTSFFEPADLSATRSFDHQQFSGGRARPDGFPPKCNLTLRNYIDAYFNPRAFITLLNSFIFALGSTLAAIALRGALAFLYERTDLRFKQVIPFMVVVPLNMPSVVERIAWGFCCHVSWRILGLSINRCGGSTNSQRILSGVGSLIQVKEEEAKLLSTAS